MRLRRIGEFWARGSIGNAEYIAFQLWRDREYAAWMKKHGKKYKGWQKTLRALEVEKAGLQSLIDGGFEDLQVTSLPPSLPPSRPP